MRSELDYLEDSQALRWALGCLTSSLKERSHYMISGSLAVSRAFLLPKR